MSLVEDVARSLKTETLLFSHIVYMFSILSMFSILPESYKTWIIGDNMYNLKNGYYMNTDVGYSRVIFANGLLGLSVFLIFNMYLIFKIN